MTPSNSDDRRAIILGASIAGLLTARVLCERFAEVVLLERDELSDRAEPRKGTPHAVHPHGLLARGREILERLFPGFSDALIEQGAIAGDIAADVAIDANGRRFARGDSGLMGLAVSRLAIEAELRRRVRMLPGTRLVTDVRRARACPRLIGRPGHRRALSFPCRRAR